jgi:glycosyltransferase involved in cell wall biosynthesis
MGIGHYSPEVTDLKEQIKRLKLKDNITLVDWTDREHILDILSSSIFYVSSSRYEGLPYSLLEAMVLSKPAIVSNIDGNTDLIKDGENGYLFNLDDVDSLANYMIKLHNESDLRERLGDAAKKTIQEGNSLPQNIETIKEIYSKLVNNA